MYILKMHSSDLNSLVFISIFHHFHLGSNTSIQQNKMAQDKETSIIDSVHTEIKHYALNKIIALNKIHEQLSQYENIVVLDLSNDLVETFCNWEVANAESDFNEYGNYGGIIASDSLRGKVKETIIALSILNRLPKLAEIYREKLCDTIRVTVRTAVAECVADADLGFMLSSSATLVSLPLKNDSQDDSQSAIQTSKNSTAANVKTMTFTQFMECLDLIFENITSLLKSAAGVKKFCIEEGISFKDTESSEESTSDSDSKIFSSQSVLLSGAELSNKSISEILRLRKDAHSLANFDEMKRLWDSCHAFIVQMESISGQKAYILRSALLAQTKAYIEHQHELNMSRLAAALDSEKWVQFDVSHERQLALDRLCSGRAVFFSKEGMLKVTDTENSKKSTFAEVEGKKYRVVWSNLLLIEMTIQNISCAAHFQTIATSVVGKTCELLRLFNSRSTSLVLEAGAIHSSARLKSINAKHLALVTQCVGVIKSILPHVRAAFMAQLQSKQHSLLSDLDKIKQDYADHHDKVLDKFVSILGGIIDHNLSPTVSDIDFDSRSKTSATTRNSSSSKNDNVECCPFLEGVITNTRKMHQVLFTLLPQEELKDVFSRILSHLDTQVPKIFLLADSSESSPFSLPSTLEGKRQMIDEVERMAIILNSLTNIKPWDFGAMTFLARRLEVNFSPDSSTMDDHQLGHDGVVDVSIDHDVLEQSPLKNGIVHASKDIDACIAMESSTAVAVAEAIHAHGATTILDEKVMITTEHVDNNSNDSTLEAIY